METEQADGMLKVAEVAELVGLSRATVLREIRRGEFEAYRVGPTRSHLRVTRASVDAYMGRRLVAPQPSATTAGSAA